MRTSGGAGVVVLSLSLSGREAPGSEGCRPAQRSVRGPLSLSLSPEGRGDVGCTVGVVWNPAVCVEREHPAVER
jgi:hypothetical protein